MKNLSLDDLQLLDIALNQYRETLESRKDFDTLEELEILQNSIRAQWREIKEKNAWSEYYAYIEKENQNPITITDYFKGETK